MGWQDIYKKKMQEAGLESDIRSTDDVQVFYREEPEQYGDWRDSFVKRMEESGMSGDMRKEATLSSPAWRRCSRRSLTSPRWWTASCSVHRL